MSLMIKLNTTFPLKHICHVTELKFHENFGIVDHYPYFNLNLHISGLKTIFRTS